MLKLKYKTFDCWITPKTSIDVRYFDNGLYKKKDVEVVCLINNLSIKTHGRGVYVLDSIFKTNKEFGKI